MEAWLEGAQLGTVVRTPLAAGSGPLGLTSRAVVDAQLPPGLVTPWVVYASMASIVGGGDFGALSAGTSPSYLEVAYGFGNQRVRAAVDLPITGGVWQLPPCAAVEVIAQLQPLGGGGAPVRQVDYHITAAPGSMGTPLYPTLTAPYKTAVAVAGQASFGRPACAIGYRVFSPSADFSASNVIAVQNNGGGALAIDAMAQRLYGYATIDRSEWFPLHPQATQVTLTNNYAVPLDLAVQWRIQLG